MREEDARKYFTDLNGRFSARLAAVYAARRMEAPSETTGISARYQCQVKVEYQRELMALLEEGMLLAVRNFKSNQGKGNRYTLLEISRVFPEHYGLKGLSESSYYPYQFEIIEQTVADWQTDDKATMMIQLNAIPLNYDLAVDEKGGCDYIKGFTFPVVAEKVHIVNKDTIHQMYNRPILERMKRSWRRIETTPSAREDPRLGVVKMFEAEEERIPIYVDFERLVRYHFGIFGFTGSGKSNLLSNILRRLIYHTTDTKVIIFDISGEYAFLLQDVLADPEIKSKLVLETEATDAEQLYKIMVKPRAFEGDPRSKATFQEMIKQGKVATYMKEETLIPTYETVLDQVQQQRSGNVDKPNYIDALDAIQNAILTYMKKNKKLPGDAIDASFVDVLDRESRGAVDMFRVSDRSNLYGWATTRSQLKQRIELTGVRKVKQDGYTSKDIEKMLTQDLRLTVLSIVEPNIIKELAIDLAQRTLRSRKKEFRVEPPILFVFDEAQEFVPAYDKARGVERRCTEQVETLLRQGRKYGIGGCIATQRIAYLNTNALQQLHTYFVGPLPRPYDRTLVSNTFTIDQGILEKTLEFAPGEWLLSSYIATGIENVPIFMKADDAEAEIEAFLS